MPFAVLPLFAQSAAPSADGSLEHAIARNIVPVSAIVLGILWLIIYSIMEEWRKVRVAEQNAILKKEMLERGFSADEIVRVIRNGAPSDKMALKSKAKPEDGA
jgi:di/tricarboxylate transporter